MTATESRIKRVLYRANHRGTKEMDIVLGRFADSRIRNLSEADLDDFEELLALPDPQIDGWIKGEAAPPAIARIVAQIRTFHSLEN